MVYQLCTFSNCNVFRIPQHDLWRAHPDTVILPSAACTALWLPVKFRICYKISVISFKAIHNLRAAYLSNLINIKRCSYLAITCGIMWALFCMTLSLSSDALLGTDIFRYIRWCHVISIPNTTLRRPSRGWSRRRESLLKCTFTIFDGESDRKLGLVKKIIPDDDQFLL